PRRTRGPWSPRDRLARRSRSRRRGSNGRRVQWRHRRSLAHQRLPRKSLLRRVENLKVLDRRIALVPFLREHRDRGDRRDRIEGMGDADRRAHTRSLAHVNDVVRIRDVHLPHHHARAFDDQKVLVELRMEVVPACLSGLKVEHVELEHGLARKPGEDPTPSVLNGHDVAARLKDLDAFFVHETAPWRPRVAVSGEPHQSIACRSLLSRRGAGSSRRSCSASRTVRRGSQPRARSLAALPTSRGISAARSFEGSTLTSTETLASSTSSSSTLRIVRSLPLQTL